MAKIHKLSYHEAQKIAAGEVVERPANVVKELIENALDAGATTISVFIEDGGKKCIRVVDNGCGMSAEDAHLCFEHHATSKITSVNDLETISTFGFRGEALSSIASISHVTLITNENTADAGIKLVRKANILTDEQPIAAPQGTDFMVRDIFYNVPARLKFLKKRETEFNQIHSLFQAYSLAYPHLHWHFSSEGSVLHNCPPVETLQQRTEQLFDQRLTQSIIPCSYTAKDNSFTISGVITDNTYARYDRSDMFFFVNQRWIKNQPLARALLKGYANTLPPGRFPAACLFITVQPDAVDINVHPRKEEVLFLHPKVVETALCGMVSTALEEGLSKRLHQTTYAAPSYSTSTYQQTDSSYTIDSTKILHTPYTAHHEPLFFGSSSLNQTVETEISHNLHSQDIPPTILTHSAGSVTIAPTAGSVTNQLSTAQSFEESEPFFNEPLLTLSNQQTITPNESEEQALPRHTILGQLHKTYIILEHHDGLYLVDQHAAHERIIYERLAQRFEDAATIQLLFPIIVNIGTENLKRLSPHLALLHQIGIGVEQFSPIEIIITATPVQAQTVDYTELIRTIIGWLHEYDHLDAHELSHHVNEKLRAQIACKAAVKAGDELTQEQMEQLLVDLSKTNNRFSCPHGRPTGWLLGTYEIEKRFRRKQ